MRLDPIGLRLETAFPKLAGSHPSDLLRDDEPRPLEDLDVLLHAGQRHLELIRETGDRLVRSAKLMDDPAAGRIGQRRKRAIEAMTWILNHVVQYITCSRRKRKPPELFPAVDRSFEVMHRGGGSNNRLLRLDTVEEGSHPARRRMKNGRRPAPLQRRAGALAGSA